MRNPASQIYSDINLPNITVSREDFSKTPNECFDTITSSEAGLATQKHIKEVIKVSETAIVMEEIINWLYTDKISADSELFPDIYEAAQKYQQKSLCNYIEDQIEELKDNHKFIISMMRIALEQEKEDLIKKLISIFRANKTLYKSTEFKKQLGQYGMQLTTYLFEY